MPSLASLARVDFVAPAEPVSRTAHVESLLRAKKLDRTLTSAQPAQNVEVPRMPWHVAELDAALAGGVKRGELSEIVGPVSSGRTTLAWNWLGAATCRGEYAALIDTFDRFDPASGAACGLALERLLWARGQALSKTAGAIDPAWLPGVRTVSGPGTLLERTIDRALKALNLVLQSQVCTAVVIDLADAPLSALRSIPASTWLRVQRVIEGSDTACLLLAPIPTARSAGGITIEMKRTESGKVSASLSASAPSVLSVSSVSSAPSVSSVPSVALDSSASSAAWVGVHDRARRLAGLRISARLVSPRRAATTEVALRATMSPEL